MRRHPIHEPRSPHLLGLLAAAAAAAATLCCPTATANLAHLDSAREFLEQTLDQLESAPNLLSLLVRKSPEERLEAEIKQYRDKDDNLDEASLLEDLHQFLYAELELDKCQQAAIGIDQSQFRFQNLRPSSQLALLIAEAHEASKDNGTTLNDNKQTGSNFHRLVQDRRLAEVVFCKPAWDRKFRELLESKLDGQVRDGMGKLYENLLTYHIQQFPSREQGTKLANYEQFERLFERPPRPASLLVFMHRLKEGARLLGLDDNMKNPNLSRHTYGLALQRTIGAICRPVCQHLQPMGDFYKYQVYNDKFRHLTSEEVARSYHLIIECLFQEQPADVTRSLVLESACCQLLDAKVGNRIVKHLYHQITSKRASVKLPPSRQVEANSGPSAVELDFGEAEFKRRRRELFLKMNGIKRNKV